MDTQLKVWRVGGKGLNPEREREREKMSDTGACEQPQPERKVIGNVRASVTSAIILRLFKTYYRS